MPFRETVRLQVFSFVIDRESGNVTQFGHRLRSGYAHPVCASLPRPKDAHILCSQLSSLSGAPFVKKVRGRLPLPHHTGYTESDTWRDTRSRPISKVCNLGHSDFCL